MRTLIFVLIGMTLGACLSLMMAAAAIFVLPMVMADAGQLANIVGTLFVAITAPLFGLAGAAIGFQKAQESTK